MTDPRIFIAIDLADRLIRSRREDSHGDPVCWAASVTAIVVAIAAAAASTAVGVAATNAQADATTATNEYNAKVAENNALAAEQQSVTDAQKIQYTGKKLIGAQEASAAKSGLAGGSGADVMYDSAIQSELDQLTTIYKGSVEGSNYSSQASLYTSAASNAQTAGTYASVGTGISNATRAGSSIASTALKTSTVNSNDASFGY